MTVADRPARGKLLPPARTDIDPIDPRPAPTPPPAPTSTAPQIAPDEGKGAQAPAARRNGGKRPETDDIKNVTVQSGINWSTETERIVREVKARTGKTRRTIVEEAIAQTWSA